MIPLVLLILSVAALILIDPLAVLRGGSPPLEDLTIERTRLTDNHVEAVVVNGGPEPVTVAQVLLDDAYWHFEIDPGPVVHPLGSATIRLEYPWVESEPLELRIVTSTGLTFDHSIDAAIATPQLSASTLASLAMVGTFVGVLPILIGLCWFPFVRRLKGWGVTFLLALTVGILLFLAADATVAAVELSPAVPTAFNGTGIFLLSSVGAASAIAAVSAASRRGRSPSPLGRSRTIALGIGLHNLGEGLAIGAAFSLGEVALTSLFVIGFALHNSTEGLAIVAPLSEAPARIRDLLLLGFIAGAPAILGTWVGAFAYIPAISIAFLGLGVGAIAHVMIEIGGLIRGRGSATRLPAIVGLASGAAVMYATAIVIAR